MVPKWGVHQDHSISTGSFSRNLEKTLEKIKDILKQEIQLFSFDQLWCANPEKCHYRGRNITSFSQSCRAWDAPSPFLFPHKKEVPRNAVRFLEKTELWEQQGCLPIALISHGARAGEWRSLPADRPSVVRVEESYWMKQELYTVGGETERVSGLLTSRVEEPVDK